MFNSFLMITSPYDIVTGPSEPFAFMYGTGSVAHEDAVKIEELRRMMNKKKNIVWFAELFIMLLL
jgi:hypothetical protein